MESLDVLGKRAKAASRRMAKFKITKKNEVLEMVADELIKKADEIKKAKDYISGCLQENLDLGSGQGPMDHGYKLK